MDVDFDVPNTIALGFWLNFSLEVSTERLHTWICISVPSQETPFPICHVDIEVVMICWFETKK